MLLKVDADSVSGWSVQQLHSILNQVDGVDSILVARLASTRLSSSDSSPATSSIKLCVSGCVSVCVRLCGVSVCVCVCLSVCVRVCFLLFVANRPFVRNCVRFHDVSGAQESTAERASSKQVQQVWRLCVCVCSCVCSCVCVRAYIALLCPVPQASMERVDEVATASESSSSDESCSAEEASGANQQSGPVKHDDSEGNETHNHQLDEEPQEDSSDLTAQQGDQQQQDEGDQEKEEEEEEEEAELAGPAQQQGEVDAESSAIANDVDANAAGEIHNSGGSCGGGREGRTRSQRSSLDLGVRLEGHI